MVAVGPGVGEVVGVVLVVVGKEKTVGGVG